MPKSTGFLNGIRFAAALCVLICHCIIWTGWPGPGFKTIHAGQAAKLAVDVFMLLSGFLMVFQHGKATALEFYAKRFFRIVPAYYAALLLACLISVDFIKGYGELSDMLGWPRDGPYSAYTVTYDFTNIALHASFLSGLFPKYADASLLPDWSLSLEMQYYAIFPLLMFALMRGGKIAVTAAIIAMCIAFTAMFKPSYVEPSVLFFKLPVFLAGMFLCMSVSNGGARRTEYLALAALALCTQFKFYGPGVWRLLAFMGLIAWLSWCPLQEGPLVARARRFFLKALDNRFTKTGADLSYSIYLFHGFFIALIGSALFRNAEFSALNPHIRTSIALVLIIAPTILAAAAVRLLIEKPGIELGRRLLRKRNYGFSNGVVGLPSISTDAT